MTADTIAIILSAVAIGGIGLIHVLRFVYKRMEEKRDRRVRKMMHEKLQQMREEGFP